MKRTNNARFAATAAEVARKRITAGIPSGDEICTGTVQRNEGGGAWVHCMVFVPALDIEEAEVKRERIRVLTDDYIKELHMGGVISTDDAHVAIHGWPTERALARARIADVLKGKVQP